MTQSQIAEDRTVVGLVQINNSFSGQNYLPYSVGMLEAYARRKLSNPERFQFRVPIYKRTAIGKAVEGLVGCDIVGFSAYVWNFEISLEIARRLRRLDDRVLIVFGGPHVPDDPSDFLTQHDFIDLTVHGEGEQTFTEVLEATGTRDWSEIRGVSYRATDGTVVRTPKRVRFRNLSEVPSPFLDGTFVPVMRANPDEKWIGLWETNRGCPFKCAFCDWGSAVADRVAVFEEERLNREVEWFAEHKVEFIFCCDANFGIKKRDLTLARYVAEVKRKTGYPMALSVQNTKNATDRAYQTQKILSDAGLNKGVALSMQSLNSETLVKIKRDNISLDTYFDLQKRFTRDNVETFSDIILGMPGETYDTLLDGVDQLICSGQHNRIQFNNLSILPNAEMGDPAYQAQHGLQTVRSRIINIHGEKVVLEDDVPEYQQLVVATATMPPADWRRSRAVCWMIALLHFDKLMQIPFILAHETAGVPYRALFDAFMSVTRDRHPLVAGIRDYFLQQAEVVQGGGTEFDYSADWLRIHWPQDEMSYIRLAAEDRIPDFYKEAEDIVLGTVRATAPNRDLAPVRDAIRLNRALLKQPGRLQDIEVDVGFNIMEFYQGIRTGEAVALKRTDQTVRIDRSSKAYDDFQAWCREVVWWGNKKGAYLYTNQVVERQLAGHF
ncbi:MAG: B12-binding domain-containing radical SAM protein [Thalassobaculum sp.]